MEKLPHTQILEKPRAVINLTGRSIAGRWSKEKKQQIYDSRIVSTKNIVRLFEDIAYRPEVFINASAVGIYGNRGGEELIEISPIGHGFLSRVTRDWEDEAKKAERYGMRVVLMRQGIVIGKGGGYLKGLEWFLKLKVLPQFGDGENWFSWIHIHDLVRVYETIILHPDIRGPVNVVSPDTIRARDMIRVFSKIYGLKYTPNIPSWLTAPLMGGFEREMSYSQRVVPQILSRQHFEWKYPTFASALASTRGQW
jgi:uncharacterized protein (TIGR01777 family)